MSAVSEHLARTIGAVSALEAEGDRIVRWGQRIARTLAAGGRLLAAGNGGSAAEAQHLTSELVGRYRDERRALSAFPLHGDTSAVTAIANDYGWERVFSRQVEAHGRTGDVVVLMSTSGRSANVLEAAHTARRSGLVTLAMTGPAPNPLAEACDDALCVPGTTTAAVQEAHLVAVHLLCDAVDGALADQEMR